MTIVPFIDIGCLGRMTNQIVMLDILTILMTGRNTVYLLVEVMLIQSIWMKVSQLEGWIYKLVPIRDSNE